MKRIAVLRSADTMIAARDENTGTPRTELFEQFAQVNRIRHWEVVFKEIIE